ncbi:MAG TPA: Lrp/AsnC family transcriptional regulator [Thermoplasmatales archaeon]|nr:Lrp/AsnC family transcriptional regulator [Thermoplasmatales archaeon]
MARRSIQQMKEDENKIINELQRNARGSIDNIAAKFKFSRQKVWRIIKRLEETKKIWGYSAIIDEGELNKKRFIILAKRRAEPLDEALSKIIDQTLHGLGEDIGVNIECSSFLHGEYDWMFIITADDIKAAKKFCNLFTTEYNKWISDIHLIEDIFSVKKCGIINPNIDNLREII